MNRRQKLVLSSIALALVSIVAISAFVIPALATNNGQNPTYEVSTTMGEARLDGEVVADASIMFIATPYGEPIQIKDRTVRIFKITDGSLTISETIYNMIPETWEGMASMNGRRFVALGDIVDVNGNEFVLVIHGLAVAHFSDGTVFRVDGTLRGDNAPNYHLVFLVLVASTG
ncbi:MAG: hypothetical protein H3Z54_07005 [archaeon]|nr:hypothetical protein [archaeon]